jgi:transposase-like protein
MPKYNEDTVNKICQLIKSDDYTVTEICKNAGISEAIYYKWKSEKVEFLEAIKKAEGERLELFKTEARKSTLKKIKGYEIEEVKEVVRKGMLIEKTTTKKHIPPDTTILIFVLKNTDNENFKDRQEVKHDIQNFDVSLDLS